MNYRFRRTKVLSTSVNLDPAFFQSWCNETLCELRPVMGPLVPFHLDFRLIIEWVCSMVGFLADRAKSKKTEEKVSQCHLVHHREWNWTWRWAAGSLRQTAPSVVWPWSRIPRAWVVRLQEVREHVITKLRTNSTPHISEILLKTLVAALVKPPLLHMQINH